MRCFWNCSNHVRPSAVVSAFVWHGTQRWAKSLMVVLSNFHRLTKWAACAALAFRQRSQMPCERSWRALRVEGLIAPLVFAVGLFRPCCGLGAGLNDIFIPKPQPVHTISVHSRSFPILYHPAATSICRLSSVLRRVRQFVAVHPIRDCEFYEGCKLHL